jgi:transcriptional regulator with XRE-family HTH domain
MNVEDIKKRLISQSKRDERWIKAAEYREANRAWLDLSSSIAIHILTKLREKNMTQKDLAEALNLSPQYINKIVKGSENLTLETITKIEKVLNITLIEVPSFSSLQNYGIDTWLSDSPNINNLRTLKSEMNLSDKPDCVYDSQSLKIA